MLRRSTVIGASRNPGSKMTLMSVQRPIALNTIMLPALLNTSESGSLAPSGSSRPARCKVPGSIDESLKFGFAFPRDGEPGSELLPGFAEGGVDVGGCRIELRRELELGECLFVMLGALKPAAAVIVFLGRPAAVRARARVGRCDRRASCGRRWCNSRPHGRNPVRLPPSGRRGRQSSLRSHRPSPRRPAPLRPCTCGCGQRDASPWLVTSAPRGILNSNTLSARPTFSLKFENWNVERPPWLSAALSDRICSVRRSTTIWSQS